MFSLSTTIAMTILSYISLLLLLLLPIVAKQNVSHRVTLNVMHNLTSSRWLKKKVNPRNQGCWNQPWICRQGEFPPKSICCRNCCVNITSDDDNCGLCGFRCKFGHKCCGGLCVDLSRNPFHCGKCFSRCKFGVLCTFGMCGYNEPPPKPFPPFPPKPPHPFPPFPPKPPHPFPPFPPKPPHPFPPAPPTTSPSPPTYSPPSPPYSPPYGTLPTPPSYSPPPSPPYYPYTSPYTPPYYSRMSIGSIVTSGKNPH